MNILKEELKINCVWEVLKIEISPKPGDVKVEIQFQNNNEKSYLKLLNPINLEFIDELIHYWDICITDKNITENNCLEFGRYQIEIWDEDVTIYDFTCDLVEYAGFGR